MITIYPALIPNPSIHRETHGHSIPEKLSLRHNALVSGGNTLMLASLIIMILTIIIAYLLPQHFSIDLQVLAHIVMLLAATAIKVGYLLRCIGRHGLGIKQL